MDQPHDDRDEPEDDTVGTEPAVDLTDGAGGDPAALDSELGWAHLEIARLRGELDEERSKRLAAELQLDELWLRVEHMVRRTTEAP